MLWTQYLIVSCFASISFSILSEASSFPFIWGLFLCVPIVWFLLVSLCFLSWSVLTPWIYGVNFCGIIPVRFSGSLLDLLTLLILLILLILGCGLCWLCVCLWFWLLLGLSLVGPSHQLVVWGSVCPPPLVFCCASVARLCWSWFFHVYKVFACSCSVICSE